MSQNIDPRQPQDKSGKQIKKLKRKVPTRDVDGIVKLEKIANLDPTQNGRPWMKISEEHKLWYRGPMNLDGWRLLRNQQVVFCYFRMVKGEMQLQAEAPMQKW